jgi:ribosomal protein S18 acetylase RimI-like enzyme
VEIRTALTSDADAIADLWVDLARNQRAHESHLRAAANRTAIREVVLQRTVNDRLLVAVEDGALVGFVMFTIESGTYEQDVVRGIVENLYVEPSFRDDGIGSELLAAAESALADDGAEIVSLEAMADNDAAHRFYRDHGYSPHRVEFEKSTESDTL